MIVETNGENGSVHSSYLLVEDMDQRESISNLVLAIYQEEEGEEVPQEEAPEEKKQPETRAQIYMNCKLAGTVILASSPRQMKSSTHRQNSLRVVNELQVKFILNSNKITAINSIDLVKMRNAGRFIQEICDFIAVIKRIINSKSISWSYPKNAMVKTTWFHQM